MNDLLGQVIAGRYRVIASLGSGGMAEVYKVLDEQRAAYLAMKLLRADLAEDVVFLRRFEREARVLKQLQHPNIVRFYGFARDGRLAYMLLEYIEGDTLRVLILNQGGPMPLHNVLAWVQPICGTLHYAHSVGVAHCDIKPANIMITFDKRVYLSDFGIARLAESVTTTAWSPGTPAYMSPEQCRGEDLDPRTDIYSLGITLYEMITGGERPFTGDTVGITGSTGERIRWQHLNERPIPPSHYVPSLSPEIEAVIMRCLEKQQEERWSGALPLLRALEAAVGKESTTPIPVANPSMAQSATPLSNKSSRSVVRPNPSSDLSLQVQSLISYAAKISRSSPHHRLGFVFTLSAVLMSIVILAGLLALAGLTIMNKGGFGQALTIFREPTVTNTPIPFSPTSQSVAVPLAPTLTSIPQPIATATSVHTSTPIRTVRPTTKSGLISTPTFASGDLEVLIDDSGSDFRVMGPSEGWRTAPYGYNESTHWTYCINEARSNWAMWVPRLPQEGYYEVFIFIPEHKAGTTRAKYRISHNGNLDSVVVPQADYANEWVSLGKYWFADDDQEEYVYLDDNTGESRSQNITIAFDAVKFVYVP